MLRLVHHRQAPNGENLRCHKVFSAPRFRVRETLPECLRLQGRHARQRRSVAAVRLDIFRTHMEVASDLLCCRTFDFDGPDVVIRRAMDGSKLGPAEER